MSNWPKVLSCVLGGALLCGCSRDPAPRAIGILPSEAAKMNQERSRFDHNEDPPFLTETHYAAGRLAESQEGYANAIEQYQAALKINRRHLPSLYRIAMIYTKQKAYPEAIKAWEAYAAATNNAPASLANLGFCYELAGDPEKAESTYKQGISAEPKGEPCRVNYGLMLARSGRTNEALLQFQAVLSVAKAHYNIASVLEQQGKRDQARIEYEKALEADPNLLDARARLASLD